MPTGIVKWFNPSKGFGFIVPDEAGSNVFIHISAVESAGLHSLDEGQKVEYDLVPGRDRKLATEAENLAVVD
jgi:CspA family cold shock protein